MEGEEANLKAKALETMKLEKKKMRLSTPTGIPMKLSMVDTHKNSRTLRVCSKKKILTKEDNLYIELTNG